MISSHILALQGHLPPVSNLESQKEYLPSIISLTTVVSHLILLFNQRELHQGFLNSIAIQQLRTILESIRCDNILIIVFSRGRIEVVLLRRMESKEFIKANRNRNEHLVALIIPVSFEFYVEGWDHVRHIFHLEFDVYVLLLILLNLINVAIVELGLEVMVVHYG
jgi:hypothetical protein